MELHRLLEATTSNSPASTTQDKSRQQEKYSTGDNQSQPNIKNLRWQEKKWSGRPDLNRRPHAPQACALPGCATPRRRFKDRRECNIPTWLNQFVKTNASVIDQRKSWRVPAKRAGFKPAPYKSQIIFAFFVFPIALSFVEGCGQSSEFELSTLRNQTAQRF
jgi:hypothetical protein